MLRNIILYLYTEEIYLIHSLIGSAMSLLKKISFLGLFVFLASCSTPAMFPDISDEVDGIRKSEGLASDGARRASIPEEDETEKEQLEDEAKPEGFMSKAESLEATATKPVETDEEDYASFDKKEKIEIAEHTPKIEDKKDIEKADSEEEFVPSVTYRLATFYFNNGSSNLSSEELARIKEIVKTAKKHNGKIRVVGYASSRTRNTDIVNHKLMNFRVSQARADSVAQALIKAGLPKQDITVEALSDSNPAYLEVMPEGERLNRRAEVYISY